MAHHRRFDAALWRTLSQTSWCLSVWIVLIALSPCARAQVDTDPANDSQSNADPLSVSVGMAITNTATLAAPDNDVDFFTVALATGDILLGMTTPLGNLPSDFDVPDTMASVLSGGVQQTFSDDDGANETPDTGMGRGSMFRFVAPDEGSYHIGVTGFEDYELDGGASGNPHVEAGPYLLTVGRFNSENSGAGFIDTDPANNLRAGADPISSAPFTAQIGVGELLAADVDFYRLSLREGDIVSAMTAPLADMPNSFRAPDTTLGLFDANGTPLIVGDDAGDESESPINPLLTSDNPYTTDEDGFAELYGSAIRALIPADGVYYLGVTGYGDEDFAGIHIELGRYALLMSIISQNSSLPGDFNSDGAVDAADYVVWRKNNGTLYDESDYNDWRENFGNSAGTASAISAAVPEPVTLGMLIASVTCALLLFKQNNH